MSMNTNDLIEAVATRIGEGKARASRYTKAVFAILSDELKGSDDKITLHKFGTFQAKKREERPGRKFQTGEKITIPAHRIVKFKPSTTLKEAVR